MSSELRHAVAGIRSAMAFLTRIPLASSTESPAARAWAPAHFPLVGALLGLIGTAVWLATAPLSNTARAWLVIIALLLVTGAFHEDGLADTADALGGAFTRERIFVILKDSRIGSFGAAALISALCLRAALLADLLTRDIAALTVVQCLSRFAPVVLLRFMPYVTPADAVRSSDVARASGVHVGVAAGWSLACCWLAEMASDFGARWGLAIALWIASTALLSYRFRRRAGGLTGDFLGTTQQVGEIALLMGMSL